MWCLIHSGFSQFDVTNDEFKGKQIKTAFYSCKTEPIWIWTLNRILFKLWMDFACCQIAFRYSQKQNNNEIIPFQSVFFFSNRVTLNLWMDEWAYKTKNGMQFLWFAWIANRIVVFTYIVYDSIRNSSFGFEFHNASK